MSNPIQFVSADGTTTVLEAPPPPRVDPASIIHRESEVYLDGSTRVDPHPVLLKNPTPGPVRISIVRESQVPNGRYNAEGKPLYSNRTLTIEIPVGATVAVSRDIADACLALRCITCDCRWSFCPPEWVRKGPKVCRDIAHPRVCGSGMAPQLTWIDERGQVMPIALEPNLVEAPVPQFDADDLHARTMRRLGGAR